MAKKVLLRMVVGPYGEAPRDWIVGGPLLAEGVHFKAEGHGPIQAMVTEETAATLMDSENEGVIRGRKFQLVDAPAAKAPPTFSGPDLDAPASPAVVRDGKK